MSAWKTIFWIIIAILVAFTLFLILAGGGVSAATNISATTTEHFAWDDVDGWWDFYAPNTARVYGTRLEGYASSSVGGYLSLDCKTSPAGNICNASNYGVCNGPGPHTPGGTCPSGNGSGELTGFAWNDTIGWVSFNCDNSSHDGGADLCPPYYSVTIDANGHFSGCAWNDIVGWISFNNTGTCPSDVDFKVVTAWRATSTFGYVESAILDTGITIGAVLQSIIWQGLLPAETTVDFQIATSSSASGPWSFRGPNGDDIAYYGLACPSVGAGGPGSVAQPDSPICVDKNIGAARYFRYKIRLRSNLVQTVTPRVDDVILNWVR